MYSTCSGVCDQIIPTDRKISEAIASCGRKTDIELAFGRH